MEGREGRCFAPAIARELGLEEIERRFTEAKKETGNTMRLGICVPRDVTSLA